MPWPTVLQKGDGAKGAPNGRGRLHWYVLRLHAMLNVSGLEPKAPMTGIYDDATVAAVKALQADRRITVDGVVGSATLAWVLGNDAPDWI